MALHPSSLSLDLTRLSQGYVRSQRATLTSEIGTLGCVVASPNLYGCRLNRETGSTQCLQRQTVGYVCRGPHYLQGASSGEGFSRSDTKRLPNRGLPCGAAFLSSPHMNAGLPERNVGDVRLQRSSISLHSDTTTTLQCPRNRSKIHHSSTFEKACNTSIHTI